jgi:septal ring factor EnvC (AmiA/AmiB activator)
MQQDEAKKTMLSDEKKKIVSEITKHHDKVNEIQTEMKKLEKKIVEAEFEYKQAEREHNIRQEDLKLRKILEEMNKVCRGKYKG